MKPIFALLSLLLSVNCFAETVECSSADGAARVSVFHYDGGVAPVKGTEITRETWTYNGVIMGAYSYLEGMPSGAVNGRLGRFDRSTITPVDKTIGRDAVSVYVIRADFPIAAAASTRMILLCQEVAPAVPRP